MAMVFAMNFWSEPAQKCIKPGLLFEIIIIILKYEETQQVSAETKKATQRSKESRQKGMYRIWIVKNNIFVL